VRFAVFGEVAAWAGDREIDLGQARRRAVLGALLVDAGRTVTADQLIDRVWGVGPPAAARGRLHNYLARLRQALPGVIERHDGGYVVRVDPLTIDLHLFRDHVRRREFGAALALAQDELLSTSDTPWARELRAEFARELFSARLAHIDARMSAGDHAELVPELRVLADEHPVDERIAVQLIEALHGSGRAPEALRHFEVVRARLAEELGAEPSRRLVAARRRLASAPRQLPAPPEPFTGRTAELALLDEAPLVVITGTGGVGKTSLAVHWAHRHADRFPDGQLHVNLHGFGPSSATVRPGDALLRLFTALDVPRRQIPDDLAAQSELFRETVRDKRILLLLDNARDAAQVAPLLPRAEGCHVIVTSRSALIGLPGALVVPLGLLPAGDARELLARRVGHDRAGAEPEAVDAMVRRCARLPLALAVAGARAAAQPQFSLTALAGELADLDAFAEDDVTDLRSVFSHSCKALSPAALRLFRLLGLMLGTDVDTAAAASLAGSPLGVTRALLAELTTAHLVEEHVPGRFTFHDLLRDYAAELAADEPDGARERLLDHLTQTAVAAAMAFSIHRDPPELPDPLPGVVVSRPRTVDEAKHWLLTERPTLMAAMRLGTPHQTWQIGWVLADVLDRQGYWQDFLRTQEQAVAALERLGGHTALPRSLINLGRARLRAGRWAESEAALNRAFGLYAGDPAGQATVLITLGMSAVGQNRLAEAIEHTRRALALFEEAGQLQGQANALTGLAHTYGRMGEYATSLDHALRALALYQEIEHITGQAEAWSNIGSARGGLGDHLGAIAAMSRSVEMYRRGGDLVLEATMTDQLGDVLAAANDHNQARAAWRRAALLYAETRQPVDHVLAKLETPRLR
jgi:DNA-binding SARP family transcriptional activator/tetratricopeptide (TPR) repeat protein